MCKVADAAIAMINYSIDTAKRTGDDNYYPDFYKLHKLLYYAQGYMLVHNKRRLFEEEIEAHKCGPFIPELFSLPIGYGLITEPVVDDLALPLTDDRVEAIQRAVQCYGACTKDELASSTKNSPPYLAFASQITDDCKPVIPADVMQAAHGFFAPEVDCNA